MQIRLGAEAIKVLLDLRKKAPYKYVSLTKLANMLIVEKSTKKHDHLQSES